MSKVLIKNYDEFEEDLNYIDENLSLYCCEENDFELEFHIMIADGYEEVEEEELLGMLSEYYNEEVISVSLDDPDTMDVRIECE